jgi:hypothetical protein
MRRRYAIGWEDNEVLFVEVDGVRYEDASEIPDPEDRARMLRLVSSLSELATPVAEPFFLSRVIVPLFFTVALLMLSICVFTAVNTSRSLAKEGSVQGYVVDVVARGDSDGREFFYPVVEFSLPDETRYTVQTSEGSWPPAYEKGQSVTVLYQRDQPRNARIKSTSSTIGMWTLPIISGFLGTAFAIGTLVAHFVLKSELGPVVAISE